MKDKKIRIFAYNSNVYIKILEEKKILFGSNRKSNVSSLSLEQIEKLGYKEISLAEAALMLDKF